MNAIVDPVAAFLDAGVWHGPLDAAEAIRAAHPDLASRSLFAAALLGDAEAVRARLAREPASAMATGGPRGWDALTYLCFSRYLRLDPGRSDGFVAAARALLDAGASARTGFHDDRHQPQPAFESALYGAAGVAHHAELTRLLLERGADPNDEEVAYHAPETTDVAVLKALVESGRVNGDTLAIMLLRKHDWHDRDGVAWLLQQGADPNRVTPWRRTPFQQAVLRDNAPAIVELALDRGADPRLAGGGTPAAILAARRGRGDLLALFAAHGVALTFEGADAVLAACASGDAAAVSSARASDPHALDVVRADGGQRLAEFAGNGNSDGVRLLLDLGVDVNARWAEGDPYWDVAAESTALHVAAWRARHRTVTLLIERGAAVDARDGKGRTPLTRAIDACVRSYWSGSRSPESVAALLRAGASTDGIDRPTGYEAIDELLGAAPR